MKDTSLFHKLFKNLEVSTLTRGQKDHLDRPLTLGEIISAISAMQNGKSPGPVGFPIDFYKKCSHQLDPLLLNMFHYSLSEGKLPDSLSEASITLLLMPGRDVSTCGSYRPVSLLNNYYCILIT